MSSETGDLFPTPPATTKGKECLWDLLETSEIIRPVAYFKLKSSISISSYSINKLPQKARVNAAYDLSLVSLVGWIVVTLSVIV